MKRIIKFIIDKYFTIQFLKYLITGVLSLIIDTSLLIILKEIIFPEKLFLFNKITIESIYIAKPIAFISAFFFNFFLNKIWSFSSQNNTIKEISYYIILLIINTIISNYLLAILTKKLFINYKISNILIIFIISLWNFLIYKFLIFKNKK